MSLIQIKQKNKMLDILGASPAFSTVIEKEISLYFIGIKLFSYTQTYYPIETDWATLLRQRTSPS